MTQYRHRLLGFLGLAGAALMFTGDMLLYGHYGPGATFMDGLLATIAKIPVARIYIGGLLGPFAACLYLLGFWHVYQNITPDIQRLRSIFFGTSVIAMAYGGAFHMLCPVLFLTAKFAHGEGAAFLNHIAVIRSYGVLTSIAMLIPMFAASLLLLILVLAGKTHYPKWTVIVNPVVLSLISPLARFMPAPLGAVVVGGETNLMLFIFFAVSLTTTWAKEDDPAPVPSFRFDI